MLGSPWQVYQDRGILGTYQPHDFLPPDEMQEVTSLQRNLKRDEHLRVQAARFRVPLDPNLMAVRQREMQMEQRCFQCWEEGHAAWSCPAWTEQTNAE